MSFISPFSQANCPYCFHSFHLSKAPRRSTDDSLPKYRDQQLGSFLDSPAPEIGELTEPEDFSFFERFFRYFYVADDWKSNSKKVCPKCHMLLPHATSSGQLNSETIAIIGARSSGKSNYFGVLLHELENRFATEVGFTIYDQETFSITNMKQISSKQLYRARYGSRLYGSDQRMAIDQNLSSKMDKDLRIPLIYRLEFPKNVWNGLLSPFTSVRSLDLVIFDAAGEDLGDPVLLEQFCSYILKASGIIFLIDPFQFSGLRESKKTNPKILSRIEKQEVDISEVVSRVINLFQSRGGLNPGQKIPIPAAFTFSKADLLAPYVHPSSAIRKDSRHENGFNLKRCNNLSEEVMGFIKEYDGEKLVNLANNKFKTSCFFAVSALGQMPNTDLQINRVAPKNVADPLLWLLWKNGYIPGIK